METAEAYEIVYALLKKRVNTMIEADGREDRFYLTDSEWEAVEELFNFVKDNL